MWRTVSYLPQVEAEINKQGLNRLNDACIHARNTILKAFTGTRTGRRYYVPMTNVMYTASAPGERPAMPTGTLSKSVMYEVKSYKGKWRGIVGTNLIYGKKLETRKKNKRPWLEPGLKDAKPGIIKAMERKWF